MSNPLPHTSPTCKNCTFTFKTLSEAHSTDLETRLRSNHPAPAHETTQIRELLSDVKVDMASCDDEISRLHSRLFSLQNQKRQLHSRMNAYKSLLAPIRKLPMETLTQILSDCCSTTDKSPTLVTLRMVCGYWSSIISSTPWLWSALFVPFKKTGMPLLESYLQRSGPSPLSFDTAQCEPEIEHDVLETLVPHSHRWQDVSFVFSYSPSDAFNQLKGNLPLLESLGLYFDSYDDLHGIDLTTLESIPRLHTLSLQHPYPGLVLPFPQVIHFSLGAVHIRNFLRFLVKCPNMETAKLTGVHQYPWDEGEGEDEGDFIVEDRTVSPIRDLFLQAYDPMDVASILFSAVTFPSLNSLTIKSAEPRRPIESWPHDAFSSFLRRSSCNLTAFTIINVSIADTDLLSLLSLLPSLTSLSIKENAIKTTEKDHLPIPPSITDALLQSLGTGVQRPFGFSQSSLLPNLRHINLKAHGSAFSDQRFVDMVKSRWSPEETNAGGRGLTCLRSAILHVMGRAFNPRKFEPLRHLAKAGMSIMISGPGDVMVK